MTKTSAEIDALRAEASAAITDARNAQHRARLAEETADALLVVIGKLTNERAFELGVEATELTLEDVIRTEDDRALVRLMMRASSVSGTGDPKAADETIERTMARLAGERGWSIADTARAILGNPTAKADQIRDSAAKRTAARVRDAVRLATTARLERLERALDAVDGKRPVTDGLAVAVIGAVIGFFTGKLPEPEHLREALVAERDRLRRQLR
jgi:hypothetical protein